MGPVARWAAAMNLNSSVLLSKKSTIRDHESVSWLEYSNGYSTHTSVTNDCYCSCLRGCCGIEGSALRLRVRSPRYVKRDVGTPSTETW